MDPNLEEILKRLPDTRTKSRLEPYREFVLRLRRRGQSFDAIRDVLAEQCALRISKTALIEFVHRRARPRTSASEAEPLNRNTVECEEQPRPTLRWTEEEIEAMRAKARASAHKPTTEPRRPPVFHYDPTRPLTNRPPGDKETNR